MPQPDPTRCPWCLMGKTPDPEYVRYHDEEWGTPLHAEHALFELLVLEAAQAGLNWRLVLHKRPGYRAAFCGDAARPLDPAVVARLDDADLERLRADERIIRNRLKIAAARQNARAFLRVREAAGSFDAYLWGFVDGRPVQNAWAEPLQVPARTPLSDAISKDLLARGFTFVGTTIVYAFLQSCGLVNDHLVSCHRHRELGGESPATSPAAGQAGSPPR